MRQSQHTLPLGPSPVEDWRAKYDDKTYPVGFWEWLADNMHVFQKFVRLALRIQARGQRRWSAHHVTPEDFVMRIEFEHCGT